MAPRESNALFNWLGATNGNFATAATGKQQLFHATMLPLWLATVLTREDLCVAILCGAPCSGKSEATRRMAAIFGDLIAVVSDDLACDAQQAPDCKEVYPQSEFDAVIRSLPQKPRVVVYDDSNVQFQNYAAKVTSALAAGVKVQNLAWFVFDQGLSENEEVEHLMVLQQKRLQNFWKSAKEGGMVTTPSYASDGKVTTPDVVRRSVRTIRKQYFINSELRLFNAEWITQELVDCAQSLQGTLDSFPSDLLATLQASTHGMVPNGPLITIPAPALDAVSSGPGLPAPPPMFPSPRTPLPPAPHVSLPTGSAHPVLGIPSLGGPVVHPNAVPTLAPPSDQALSLSGDQQPWDQPITPLYFVFANGHNNSAAKPTQLQFNAPSSAAAPPFTVANPVTSSGEHVAAPATQPAFDDTSLAYALCFSHRPTSGHHGPTFREDAIPPPPSPASQTPGFKSFDSPNGVMNGKMGSKAEKRGRKDHKSGLSNGHSTNGHTNGHAQTNGHGAQPSNGHTNGHNSNGNCNANSNGLTNGQKGNKQSKAPRNPEAKGKASKKKPQNGWASSGLSPFMNGGLTLRSVLNEYWKTHKMELDGNGDFDFTTAELLAKSSMSMVGMDEESMLSSLQALIDDGDETECSTPSPPQSF
jgi:hypothetical protein